MFLDNLTNLMELNNLNKNTFSKQSGIPYKTIDNFWKKGCDNIKLSTLKKIAEYFDVSLDFLIFGNSPNINHIVLNCDEHQLISDYRDLSIQGQEYIKQTMFIAKQTYKKSSDNSVLEESGT